MDSQKNAVPGRYTLPGTLYMILLLLADQLSKYLAGRYLKGGRDIELIPGVFRLHYLYPENRGMAFGMLQNRIVLFAVFTLALILGILYVYRRIPRTAFYLPLIAAGFTLLAGALGNLIDRILRGYVIDFLYFSLIDFPVFNLADVYVVIGSALLALLVIFRYKGEHDLDFLSRRKKPED